MSGLPPIESAKVDPSGDNADSNPGADGSFSMVLSVLPLPFRGVEGRHSEMFFVLARLQDYAEACWSASAVKAVFGLRLQHKLRHATAYGYTQQATRQGKEACLPYCLRTVQIEYPRTIGAEAQ